MFEQFLLHIFWTFLSQLVIDLFFCLVQCKEEAVCQVSALTKHNCFSKVFVLDALVYLDFLLRWCPEAINELCWGPLGSFVGVWGGKKNKSHCSHCGMEYCGTISLTFFSGRRTIFSVHFSREEIWRLNRYGTRLHTKKLAVCPLRLAGACETRC